MVPCKKAEGNEPRTGKVRGGGLHRCIRTHGNGVIFQLIGGTYGYRSDQDGCLISSGLAMELFGGLDVAGKYIWCRQKPYRIRGVTDDSSHVILLPAKDKDAMRYMMFT